MYNFKIVDVSVGEYKLKVELENIDTEERNIYLLPNNCFFLTELQLIKENVESQCPENFYFKSTNSDLDDNISERLRVYVNSNF